MTTFDEREDTFEKKYIHDERLRFQILSRRNQLLYVWMMERANHDMNLSLNLSEIKIKAQDFAFTHAQNNENEIAKVVSEYLKSQNIESSAREIRQKMMLFWEEAAEAVVESKGSWLL